jgi:hypothetical protein
MGQGTFKAADCLVADYLRRGCRTVSGELAGVSESGRLSVPGVEDLFDDACFLPTAFLMDPVDGLSRSEPICLLFHAEHRTRHVTS